MELTKALTRGVTGWLLEAARATRRLREPSGDRTQAGPSEGEVWADRVGELPGRPNRWKHQRMGFSVSF